MLNSISSNENWEKLNRSNKFENEKTPQSQKSNYKPSSFAKQTLSSHSTEQNPFMLNSEARRLLDADYLINDGRSGFNNLLSRRSDSQISESVVSRPFANQNNVKSGIPNTCKTLLQKILQMYFFILY